MITRVFNHSFTQVLLSLVILAGAFFCVFAPNFLIFQWGVSYAFQIMLSYLALGFSFLLLKQPRLMFTSFACCAGLCLYLKYSSDSTFGTIVVKNDAPQFTVAHVNLTNSNETPDHTIETLLNSSADLLSVQELTPNWQPLLEDCLKERFPYQYFVPDAGIFGMAVLSRTPFDYLDTFHYREVPNIIGCIKNGENDVCFVSAHTFPALDQLSYLRLKEHLAAVSQKISALDLPVVLFGDLHAVSWSKEIQSFRVTANLKDSRRGFLPSYPDGNLPFFEVPIDHIFYSDPLQCLDFKTLSTPATDHLGILATFQNKHHAQEPVK